VGRAPTRGKLLVFWGEVVYMTHIFILNEILERNKIYILVGTLLG
jgi:hypothetical protein